MTVYMAGECRETFDDKLPEASLVDADKEK